MSKIIRDPMQIFASDLLRYLAFFSTPNILLKIGTKNLGVCNRTIFIAAPPSIKIWCFRYSICFFRYLCLFFEIYFHIIFYIKNLGGRKWVLSGELQILKARK